MKWLALIALWAASAAVGLHLAQQESLGAQHALLIVGWLALAFGVAALFVRSGRNETDRPG